MKTIIRIHLLAAIGLLALAGFSPAQQMPQDNWRYDGLEFSGPDANKPLRSIAIASGGPGQHPGSRWQNCMNNLSGGIT